MLRVIKEQCLLLPATLLSWISFTIFGVNCSAIIYSLYPLGYIKFT